MEDKVSWKDYIGCLIIPATFLLIGVIQVLFESILTFALYNYKIVAIVVFVLSIVGFVFSKNKKKYLKILLVIVGVIVGIFLILGILGMFFSFFHKVILSNTFRSIAGFTISVFIILAIVATTWEYLANDK